MAKNNANQQISGWEMIRPGYWHKRGHGAAYRETRATLPALYFELAGPGWYFHPEDGEASGPFRTFKALREAVDLAERLMEEANPL
jgi:hypothetical protein